MPDTSPNREAIELLAAVIGKLGTSIAPPADPLLPEGLNSDDAARFCGISTSAWHDYDARGLVPEGIVIGDGRARRWLRTELISWLRAGAPARARWSILKNQQQRKAG